MTEEESNYPPALVTTAYGLCICMCIPLLFFAVGWVTQFVFSTSSTIFEIAIVPWIVIGMFGSMFMSIPAIYIGMLVGCTLVLLLAMFNKQIGYGSRLLFIATLIMLSVFAFKPHSVHLTPLESNTMEIVTQPKFGMSGMHFAQSMVDVKPCRYFIKGWANNVAYYREVCGSNETLWSFRPNQSSPQLVTQIPDMVEFAAAPNNRDWIDHPTTGGMDGSMNLWLYEDNVAISADSQHVAAVSKNLYGPEDVVIVSKK